MGEKAVHVKLTNPMEDLNGEHRYAGKEASRNGDRHAICTTRLMYTTVFSLNP